MPSVLFHAILHLTMPKHKSTIYLETSVISAYFDFWQTAPKQKQLTREFWKKVLPEYNAVISEAVLLELNNAKAKWAQKFKKLVQPFTILPLNEKSMQLSKKYIKADIIPAGYKEDSFHLAIACIQKCDYLATWNTEHLARPYKLHQIYHFNKKHKIHFPILIKPEHFLNNL